MGRDQIISVLKHLLLFNFFIPAADLSSLQAQGLILDEDDETKQAYVFKAGRKSATESLKGIYKIDLKPYAPLPQNQGAISSCTGWATGYGAMSIMQAVKQNWKDSVNKIKNNAFSALFIYNQIWKGGCDYGGSNILDAGKLLVEKGNVSSKEFDRFKNKCDRLPNEAELRLASKSKIQEFAKVFSPDEPALNKIDKTKLSLAKKLPVVIGINLRKNFKEIKSNELFWKPQYGDTTFYCAHAMVVVGFDDDRQAFEVMNSWGTEWANGGFVWIKYKDYAEYAKHAYHFIPFNYHLKDEDIEVQVELESPYFSNDGVLGFRVIPALNEGDIYQPAAETHPGDQLRINVFTSKSNCYIYCFSIDSKKFIKLHWPRDLVLDSKFSGNHESGRVTGSYSPVYIPGEYKALQFELSGTEHLFILTSPNPILKINDYLTTIKTLNLSDPYAALYKAFGKQLINRDKLNKSTDKIRVTTEFSNKLILPVIIKLDLS
ncbi:MAG: C1 family peptidase [Saprospiraceae bacterium]|nr:C1 family peptidase [Saprospiraceae bacterium]